MSRRRDDERRRKPYIAKWDETRCAGCDGVIMTGDDIILWRGDRYHLHCTPGGDDQ